MGNSEARSRLCASINVEIIPEKTLHFYWPVSRSSAETTSIISQPCLLFSPFLLFLCKVLFCFYGFCPKEDCLMNNSLFVQADSGRSPELCPRCPTALAFKLNIHTKLGRFQIQATTTTFSFGYKQSHKSGVCFPGGYNCLFSAQKCPQATLI